MVGICSFGGYIPRYRLNRGMIVQSMAWINPIIMAHAQGEKAVANFDEDAITMAVAAGIDALQGIDPASVEGVYLASTTMPYKERLNAAIAVAPLNVPDQVRAADFSGGLKAGTTAILAAIEGVESKNINNILVASADCRLGRPGSTQEIIFGDAGAAFLIGDTDVIAEFKGSYSVTYDFADHMRGSDTRFDRQWEERWIRDLGYADFIPEVINGLLDKYQMKISDFSKVIYPCNNRGGRKKINGKLGISPEIEQSNLQTEIGDSGTSLPLVMLANALEDANPGDRILVVSYGSGCDALFFEVTEQIKNRKNNRGISGSLANKAALDNYTKYLVWRNILPVETGMRGEVSDFTALSTLWRRQKEINGMWGSRCKKCNTPQYPPQRICANPECGSVDQMEPYAFADKTGHVITYTGDMLASSFDPPSIYGRIDFQDGGRCNFDFTDCDLEDVKTGTPVTLSFRKKYHDRTRDIVGYFWKAVPVKEVKKNG